MWNARFSVKIRFRFCKHRVYSWPSKSSAGMLFRIVDSTLRFPFVVDEIIRNRHNFWKLYDKFSYFLLGPCCDPMTCSHRSSNYLCRPGDECAHPSRCRNLRGFDNYQCPGRGKKWDFKPCATQSQVCIDGICSNSVCRRYGLTECQCSSKKYECYVCCNFLGRCVPALNIPQVGFVHENLFRGKI